MDGLILIHKPSGCTSHDVVHRIRKVLGGAKTGHFGTLDPMATGLMLIGVGKATRLFSFFLRLEKVYSGKIRLGFSTDTYDSTGTRTSPEIKDFPSREKLAREIKNFEGDIVQTAPPYSAKKYRGKPLYALARQNKRIPAKSSAVHVHYFKVIHYSPPHIQFETKCSSGTYIRSLAHDLGTRLGCGGHLTALVRESIGPYSLSESRSPEAFSELVENKQLSRVLIPIERLLPEYPTAYLTQEGERLARNGNLLLPSHFENQPPVSIPGSSSQKTMILRLFDKKGRLIAFAKKKEKKDGFQPFLVIETFDRP